MGSGSTGEGSWDPTEPYGVGVPRVLQGLMGVPMPLQPGLVPQPRLLSAWGSLGHLCASAGTARARRQPAGCGPSARSSTSTCLRSDVSTPWPLRARLQPFFSASPPAPGRQPAPAGPGARKQQPRPPWAGGRGGAGVPRCLCSWRRRSLAPLRVQGSGMMGSSGHHVPLLFHQDLVLVHSLVMPGKVEVHPEGLGAQKSAGRAQGGLCQKRSEQGLSSG